MYAEQAAAMIVGVKEIIQAVRTNGLGTMTIMTILRELLAMTTLVEFIRDLDGDEREVFLAEVFDQAIGTEPHALVNQLGPISGEALEQFSDGLKAAFIAMVNQDSRLT